MIAAEQAHATKKALATVHQLLDYCATLPDAKIRYYASDMILNIHSDSLYLCAPQAKSRIGGHFFLVWIPQDNVPIKLNGAIHIVGSLLKFVAASAAEAESGVLFVNAKEGKVLRLILHELGHKQPTTPIHCENTIATAIAKNTVKKQRSRSINKILLDNGTSSTQYFFHPLATRPRNPCRLPF